MKDNKYLPIGTVIRIDGQERPIIIVGYMPECEGEAYDYEGYPYPEGFVDSEKSICFTKKLSLLRVAMLPFISSLEGATEITLNGALLLKLRAEHKNAKSKKDKRNGVERAEGNATVNVKRHK